MEFLIRERVITLDTNCQNKMKKLFIAAFAALAILSSCKDEVADNRVNIIFETDFGNDVDDAIAMDMLFKYVEAGKINLLAINVNKDGKYPGEYADIMRKWYGHTEVPVGIVRNGAKQSNELSNYAQKVVDMTDEAGNPLFERTIPDFNVLPDAHVLTREILASMPDKSVTIVSVGFSTNLIRLMESGADEYSKLNGMELIAQKVDKLVMMAGGFKRLEDREYNVYVDVPAAKAVFESWPTAVVTSPFEVGDLIRYPATSIENDFGWAKPAHPMCESYKNYLKMPYDRQTWDPTAVLYAVEGEQWFTMSPKGKINVTEIGNTHFTADDTCDRQYLQVDSLQAAKILDHFIEIVTSKPAIYQE